MKRYDIVGCGSVVRTYHAPILRNLVGRHAVGIRGCYDLNREAARAMGARLGASHTGTPEDIGDLSAVDAVLIATPPESHAVLIERYLSAGKSVLVEKPFVGTLAEAETVVRLSRSVNAPVLVGHFRRLYPGQKTARAFLAGGGLGRIHRVEATEGGRWSWPTLSRYVIESPLGGVIYDTGSHLLDMVLHLLDADAGGASFELLEVTKSPAVEPAHACRARMRLRDAAHAVEVSFAVSRLEPLAGAVKVHGEAGTLIVPTSFSTAPLLVRGSQVFRLEQPDGGAVPTDAIGCFVEEHQEFLEMGPGVHEESPLSAARFVVLTAILESLAKGSG
jgi:predicted dehydrogenase